MRRLFLPLCLLFAALSLFACTSGSKPAEEAPRPEAPFSTVPDTVIGVVRVNIEGIDTEPIADGLRRAAVGERSFSSAVASLLATGQPDREVAFLGDFGVLEFSIFEGKSGPESAPTTVLGMKGRFTTDDLGGLLTANGWKAGGDASWTKDGATLMMPMENVALMSDDAAALATCRKVLEGAQAPVTRRTDALGARTKNSYGLDLIEGHFLLPTGVLSAATATAQAQEEQYAGIPGMKETVAEINNLRVIGLTVGAETELLGFALEFVFADADAAGRALPGLKSGLAMGKMMAAAALANDPASADAQKMLNRLRVDVGDDPATIAITFALSTAESARLGDRFADPATPASDVAAE